MTADVCPECATYLSANPHIIGACASVGIERKRSTPDMVQMYMARIHEREGHASWVLEEPSHDLPWGMSAVSQ